MKLLLDTHILLWMLTDNEKLPQKARSVLSSMDNDLYYSTASIWEIAIKHADPFDRIMVAQAKSENMMFVTHDSLIPYYMETCIMPV